MALDPLVYLCLPYGGRRSQCGYGDFWPVLSAAYSWHFFNSRILNFPLFWLEKTAGVYYFLIRGYYFSGDRAILLCRLPIVQYSWRRIRCFLILEIRYCSMTLHPLYGEFWISRPCLTRQCALHLSVITTGRAHGHA